MKVHIYIKFPEIKNLHRALKRIAVWVCKELELESKIISLAVIFINDDEIKELHRKFLAEPIYTDIITFNLGDNDHIEGEIYISLERAKLQAENYKVSLINEISRLIVHGCLHLAGFDDYNNKTRKIMKQKEDNYVEKIQKIFLN